MEEDSNLAFLNTAIYRKPTNSSHSILQWQNITVKVLIHRAIRICSNKNLQDKELDIIKHSDVKNYLRNFAQNIGYNLHRKPPHLSEVKNSKEIFFNLKYTERRTTNVEDEENS